MARTWEYKALPLGATGNNGLAVNLDDGQSVNSVLLRKHLNELDEQRWEVFMTIPGGDSVGQLFKYPTLLPRRSVRPEKQQAEPRELVEPTGTGMVEYDTIG